MTDRTSDEAEIASGRFFMMFCGVMQLVIFVAIVASLIPTVEGLWLLLALSAALFFGCSALFFFIYCLPPRPCSQFRLSDGSYLLVRPRLVNIVHSVGLIFTGILLPMIALYLVALVPIMILYSDQLTPPDFGSMNIIELFELVDAVHGLIFVIIPLLIAFPWLYPKFLRLAKSTIMHTFSDVGLKLEPNGLSILGPDAKFIPWAWITNVESSVHGQTGVVVFKGSDELEKLKIKLDRRLPKAITNEFEWKKDGLPMKLEFLQIRASELAELIRSEFLAQRTN